MSNPTNPTNPNPAEPPQPPLPLGQPGVVSDPDAPHKLGPDEPKRVQNPPNPPPKEDKPIDPDKP